MTNQELASGQASLYKHTMSERVGHFVAAAGFVKMSLVAVKGNIVVNHYVNWFNCG
jgi:hypothetical protein